MQKHMDYLMNQMLKILIAGSNPVRGTNLIFIIMQTKNYNIVYMVAGVIRETLAYNKPHNIAKFLKHQAEQSGNYYYGKIFLIEVK